MKTLQVLRAVCVCLPRGMVRLCLTSLLKLLHPGLAANWYWKWEVFDRVSKESACTGTKDAPEGARSRRSGPGG